LRETISTIKNLCRERNAIILAHNYQPPEIQEIADFVGDSLDLSRKASEMAADVVVFCGVRFMAETAAVISPEKTVLLPDLDAGCPLADTIEADKLELKKRECPPGTVVVCYVNSPVEVKAGSDICCTSANAARIVDSLGKANILFVPDENLGRCVSSQTGKKLILWKGSCPAHVKLRAHDITEIRKKHPEAVVVVHPECLEEVTETADAVLSTGGMVEYAQTTSAREIIVGTEEGLIYRLQKENPEKAFYPACEELFCTDMKVITLQKVLESLKELKHRIVIPGEIADKARKSIERMLEA
jgi:quinolinate synthase